MSYQEYQPKMGLGRKLSLGMLATFIAVLLGFFVIQICGFGRSNNAGSDPVAVAPTAPSASASPARSDPSPSPTPSPAWSPVVDQCVRNVGTNEDPKLEHAKCGKGTYKIVHFIPFTDDMGACRTATKRPYDATYMYRYTSGYYTYQYVLCLKRQ